MRCPVCQLDMIVVEYKNIELDYCTKCQGAWFDCGELELLITKAEGTSSIESNLCNLGEAQTDEAKRKCPICRKKMRKVLVGEEPKVLIDSCPRGEGLWFDGGEIDQLLAQQTKAEKSEMISFLNDVFQAKNKPE